MADFSVNPNLEKPKYSVIMLIFNRTEKQLRLAQEAMESVHANSEDYEFIVVDNGSTLRYDWESKCDTYIRLSKNWGISHGWNIGLKAARGKYLVIIGDDVKVRHGWLEAMEEGMQQPSAGMCNPYVEHLPYLGGIVENYKWPSGACFMLSRETVEKVGYFNENLFFPAQFEDTSYWTRLYKAGLKIYTNYAVTVRHHEGQTDNSPDIAMHFDKQKKIFIETFGFDPIPYFCGNGNLNDVLKNIEPNDNWRPS